MVRFCTFFLIFIFLSNTGYSQENQKNEEIERLLIIGLVGHYDTRKMLEQEIKFQLGQKGIRSVTSFHSSLHDNLDKEHVLDYCEKVEADGVLFVKLNKVRKATEYERKEKNPNLKVNVYVWGGFFYGSSMYTAGANTKVKIEGNVLRVPDGEVLHKYYKTVHVGPDVEESVAKFSGKLASSITKMKGLSRAK